MMQLLETFEKIYNFRDMGGQVTKDGRSVKKGLLFRCGELGHATNADLIRLKDMNIQVIFDYRDDHEASTVVTPTIEGVTNIRVPANTNLDHSSTSLENMLKNPMWTRENALGHFYADMLFENESYKALLACIREQQVPLVHHCAAGKDRTGVGAALIYLLLGVSEEAIIEEYLLTNEATAKKPPLWFTKMKEQMTEYEDVFGKMAGVEAVYMQTVFDRIKENYSSYEAYFKEEFGIDEVEMARLKDYYLEVI
ncbi:tyrosine-protein phosphatase [Lysinibacillus sp. NPDC097214]|uniref:tyrosine-protein phosphatase n=1 Tax=Lysinibacillus sp. NPDC097214 TaxID=3390584 RepID=UPI003D062037